MKTLFSVKLLLVKWMYVQYSLALSVPPTFVQVPRNKSVSESNVFTFSCLASGSPTPVIMWTDPSGQITKGQTYTKYNVQRKSEGWYHCRASNGVGQEIGTASYLTVNYSPENTQIWSNVDNNIVEEGGSVFLSCYTTAKPLATLGIYHNNVKIKEVQSTSVLDLEFKHTRRTSHGQWFCQASNTLGWEISSRLFLVVQVPPMIINTPRDLEVPEGGTVSFQCIVSGRPAPTVTWTEPSGKTNSGSIYRINNVQKNDQGLYQCKATNGIGDDATVNVSLTVNYAPEYTGMWSNVENDTVTEGESLILTCYTKAQPLATITIYHNSVKIQEQDSRNVVDLVFRRTPRSAHGLWYCKARNKLGEETSSTLNLLVQDATRFIDIPVNQTVSEGMSVTSLCKASGNPSPTITWTEPSGQIKRGSIYTKNNVQRTDQGLYQCQASYQDGNEITTQFYLTVNYLDIDFASSSDDEVYSWDGHVTKLSCAAVGQPDMFNFSWNGPITQNITNQGRVSTLIFTPSQDDHYGDYKCTITNAAGNKEYQIKLRRISVPESPSISTVVLSSMNSIKVFWSVSNDDSSKAITQYTIEWSENGKNGTQRSINTSNQFTEITGLKSQTNYSIRVRAWNGAGQGERSHAKVIKTLSEGQPAVKPQCLFMGQYMVLICEDDEFAQNVTQYEYYIVETGCIFTSNKGVVVKGSYEWKCRAKTKAEWRIWSKLMKPENCEEETCKSCWNAFMAVASLLGLLLLLFIICIIICCHKSAICSKQEAKSESNKDEHTPVGSNVVENNYNNPYYTEMQSLKTIKNQGRNDDDEHIYSKPHSPPITSVQNNTPSKYQPLSLSPSSQTSVSQRNPVYVNMYQPIRNTEKQSATQVENKPQEESLKYETMQGKSR